MGKIVFHLEIFAGLSAPGDRTCDAGRPGQTDDSLHGNACRRYERRACAGTIARRWKPWARLRAPAKAQVLRGVALELERIANHTGDLGALAGDVGYLPTLSYCGRIRGDVLNMTALICGNRFGRGLIRPGGVGFDVDKAMRDELLSRLEAVEKDLSIAVKLLWNTSSVMAAIRGNGRGQQGYLRLNRSGGACRTVQRRGP